LAIAKLYIENVTYLIGGGAKVVTVCDRRGENLSKVPCTTLYIRYGQPLISKDNYN